MAPRLRMQIVAAADEPAPLADGRFHALIILEGVETGDKRIFVEGSLGWRDLPLPLMGTDRSDHGGLGDTSTVLIGNFDTIERRGAEIHGWGAYITDPTPEAAHLIQLVQSGELRGISADVDAVEFELLLPVEPEDEDEPADDDDEDEPADDEAMLVGPDGESLERETGDDGQEYVVLPITQPILRVTEGRVMGATVVPFQAFMEAFIEPDGGGEPALAASAAGVLARDRVTGGVLAAQLPKLSRPVPRARPAAARSVEPAAAYSFPTIPPHEFFTVPEPDEPTPLTWLPSGLVLGHLATWGECHIGLSGECISPPRSHCDYARFHVGECPTDRGTIATGKLTFNCGHAPLNLGMDATRSFYDHSGQVAADVVAFDGVHGIWICGAARSTLSLAQVREVMTSPPSGDWRMFGQHLELVAALCVNVPGFNTPRMRVRKDEYGLVASLQGGPRPVRHARRRRAAGDGVLLDRGTAARLSAQLAASIGRSPQDRIAALAARVHGS